MFEDSHGGLWLGGCETGAEGLFFFDGSRFIPPLKPPFPKLGVSGMAEDSDGGIWMASTGGLYRLYQGHLEKLLDGQGMAGITKVAPDVFLATIARPGHDTLMDADLIWVARVQGKWNAEALMRSVPQVQFRMDRSGNILYGCEGGYCELRSSEIAQWRPGSAFSITRHRVRTRRSYAAGQSVVWRDHFGCVWMRARDDASYLCPGDVRPVILPESVASIGTPLIIELEDGSIVLPGFGRIAIGRPGKFRVLTMVNGYPSMGNALAMKDGSLLLSNANGLFLMPLHMRMEFWSQRDGLDGNTWSVLHMGKKVFAIAGDSVRVLNEDRSGWQPLAPLRAATHLIAGPDGSLLAGSHTEGVVQLSTDGTVLRRSAPADVGMLAQTPDGQFWASGGSVFRIGLDGRRLDLQPANVPDPLGGSADMKVDADGSLWACYAGGLAHKDGAGWHRISKNEGLQENNCLSFAIDPGGDIWYSYNTFPGSALIEDPTGRTPLIHHFQNGEASSIPQSHFL